MRIMKQNQKAVDELPFGSKSVLHFVLHKDTFYYIIVQINE